MNNKTTGMLNINRLIEEAEALLLGAQPAHLAACKDNCGKCKSQTCSDKNVQRAIRRPLATAAAR